ncbi:recombinase family protein [Paenibacillus larvae subsp. pulvifaciens]|uniref:Recombinase family protein n=1 Tax=Paenibacillus larvae subsp. pulvifaciens TaxID=1477 RepID=A0A1V0UQU3_9BACL|nr:recombinase family protein [Paenibacillus larvae]ARF67328.1 recombinase family protein [Paenibacillus larvae subsp. pulvifaciens]
MRTAIYLRKSRADLEAESRGEGETLTKHRKALMKLARVQKLTIVRVYEEIVSGESLFHRPEMNELLKNVDNNEYDAVLVMDIDRLGRGNMQEQGLILDTFRRSNTKIITPRKTYDLNDEWDEEYSEFEAFMARKELKIITRRLQGGRVRAVEEGKYLGTRPPYGYDLHFEKGIRTLKPNPAQAPYIKMIFDLYTHPDPKKRLGSGKIAKKLNELKVPTSTGKQWEPSTVIFILKNAVYAGRIQWKKVERKKSTIPGKKRSTQTRKKSEWIDVKGLHEPIISIEKFNLAKDILSRKYHIPYQLKNGVRNPLAGLIVCGKCNRKMVYRPYGKQKPHLICINQDCDNKSSRVEYVEDAVIKSLQEWLKNHEVKVNKGDSLEESENNEFEIKVKALHSLENELKELEKQKLNLFDFLERGIYSEDTFIERSQNIAVRITNTSEALEKVKYDIDSLESKNKQREQLIPEVIKVISLYRTLGDPSEKNELLKRVVDHAIYTKEKKQRNEDFNLNLYVRMKTDNINM